MPDTNNATFLGLVVVVSPRGADGRAGDLVAAGLKLAEETTTRLVYAAIVSGLLAAVAVLAIMLVTGKRHIPIELGDWVVIPGYHFSVKFIFDRLSVPFAILSYMLSGTIGAFASRYMHRERGFDRFFVLYAIFRAGHGRGLAGRHGRNVVRRLGTGRPVVGAAGRFLPGAAGAGPQRACGSGSSTASPMPRCCWPPWPCTI